MLFNIAQIEFPTELRIELNNKITEQVSTFGNWLKGKIKDTNFKSRKLNLKRQLEFY